MPSFARWTTSNFVEEWGRLTEGKNVILSRIVSKALRERLVEHLEPSLKTSLKASYVDRKPRTAERSQAARGGCVIDRRNCPQAGAAGGEGRA